MKTSEINFKVTLDDNNLPEDIVWEATDKPDDIDHTKTIAIAVWDEVQKNTLFLNIWTKEMPVTEMKKFYIDSIGAMSQYLLTATGDEAMANELKETAARLEKMLVDELNRQ
ncbi:MAG TPA: gliding motility protein GldC [Flammeovirgaceae bacterium]|nr:gliding motility protein GldC [Flammeovirgaceae bacterium]